MKPRHKLIIGALLAITFHHHASADTYNWIGGNGTWDTATANWSGAGTVWPATSTLTDIATFASSSGTVTIATGGITANGLTFNTSGYTINGAALTLDGASPTVSTATGISASISSIIAGSAGLTKSGDGTLTLSGANTHTGPTLVSAGILRAGNAAALGANTANTTVSSGAALDVNGQNLGAEIVEVSGSGIGSSGAITNTGADQSQAFRFVTLLGATTFGGPNRWDIRKPTASTSTFDMGGFALTKTGANYLGLVDTTILNPGNVTINQGTLNFTFASTLGLTSAKTVTVNSGGILGLFQSAPLHGSNLILNSGSTLRGESGSGAQNTWAGTIAATGEVTLQADGVLTLAGSITGTANLTKTGGSTATIAPSGSIGTTGNLAVNGGTLIISGTSSFTGSTTLTSGTLNLNYETDDNGKLPDSAALVLAGGNISLTGGTHSEVVASTTLNANSASAVSVVSGSAVLNLNSITVGTGASLNFGTDSIATTDNTNTNGILGTWATVGDNQWAVNSTNGADGPVTALTDFVFSSDLLNDNTLYQNEHVVINSTQTPDAAINPLSLAFNSAAANSLTLQGTNSIVTGGILVGTTVGNNASTLTGGSLTGSLDTDLFINQKNTANTLTIASSIVNNGTTGLQKNGAGTLVLSGNNTYSGTTQIASGNLQIASGSAIGDGLVTTSGTNNAALVLGDGIIVPSSKSISVAGNGANGFYGALSTAIGNIGTSEWQGTVTIAATTGTRIGTLGGTLHVSGNIGESSTGSQLLVRNNEAASGTTILSGNNTFSGGLQLVVGNLRMGSANALGTGPLTLGSGGNVNAFSSDSATPRTISLPTSLAATGTTNLGDATLNGKLTFANTFDLGSATRTLSTASEVEVSGTLTGSGTLVKTGASSLILSNANTHTGAVQINGGTVVLAHKNALTTSSSVFVSTTAGSGTLRLATDESVVLNRIETSSSNPGKIISDRATPGSGIVHTIGTGLLGANTYSFEAGPNVTSGIARVTLNSANLTAGNSNATVLNPTTAVVTIDGPVNIGFNNLAKTLRLDGTNSGNLISGVVSNGLNTLNLIKSGSSDWELSGANSYTGTTTVRQGTLTLSGARTNVTIGTITVGDTAGLSPTLNISNGNHNLGGGQMNVGNAPTTAITATVNQTGGAVSFAAGGGNQLLVGQNTVANRGIYNLSGGSLTIGLSTSNSRGVMLGVNTGSSGGTFNLSGTGQLNMTAASGGTGNATLQVGRFDSAANNTNNDFNQSGGTANVGVLSMGGNGGTGTGITSLVSLTGGTFSANVFSRMAAGNTNTATLIIGGTADVTLPAFPTTRGTGSTATLVFDGGTLKPLATSPAYIGGLTNAFIKSGGAKFNTNSFDITVSQNLLTDPISAGGGLTKEGSGTLTLTGTNTYTGNTSVTAGTLSLGNGTANTSLANTADVSVASGATLNLNYAGTDTIDGLTINGVAKSPGIWGSASSGAPNTDPQLTGSGTLTVTTGPSASAYDTWASGFSLTGPNAAFDFDFDNDGIDNGLEWILGGNPTTNSAGILPNATTNPAGDLILSFTREEDAIPETTLIVEFGTDLASWPKQATIGGTSSGPDANGVTVNIDTGASPDDVTVTIPASNAPAGKIFARLKASQP